MRPCLVQPAAKLLFAGLLLLLLSSAHAVPWGEPNPPLPPGLKVAVRVTGIPDELRHQGYDRMRLNEEIVKRLQEAGIEVLGQAEASMDPDAAILHFDCRVNETIANYSFLIMLKLERKALLAGDPSAFTTRTVWREWKIGGVERQRTHLLEVYALELLQRFVDQYRADTAFGAQPPL